MIKKTFLILLVSSLIFTEIVSTQNLQKNYYENIGIYEKSPSTHRPIFSFCKPKNKQCLKNYECCSFYCDFSRNSKFKYGYC